MPQCFVVVLDFLDSFFSLGAGICIYGDLCSRRETEELSPGKCPCSYKQESTLVKDLRSKRHNTEELTEFRPKVN